MPSRKVSPATCRRCAPPAAPARSPPVRRGRSRRGHGRCGNRRARSGCWAYRHSPRAWWGCRPGSRAWATVTACRRSRTSAAPNSWVPLPRCCRSPASSQRHRRHPGPRQRRDQQRGHEHPARGTPRGLLGGRGCGRRGGVPGMAPNPVGERPVGSGCIRGRSSRVAGCRPGVPPRRRARRLRRPPGVEERAQHPLRLGRLQPPFRIAFEESAYDGQQGPGLFRRADLVDDDRVQDAAQRVAAERGFTAQHRAQQRAQRPQVGLRPRDVSPLDRSARPTSAPARCTRASRRTRHSR